jgi:hypothetical protein
MACSSCNKKNPTSIYVIGNEPKFVVWIMYIFTSIFFSVFGFVITMIMLSNVFWGSKNKIQYMKDNVDGMPLIYNIESNALKVICFVFLTLASLLLSWIFAPIILYKQFFGDAKVKSSDI